MYVTDKPVNNNSIGGEGRSERKGAVVVESLADDQGPPDSSFIRIKISHLCVCIYIYFVVRSVVEDLERRRLLSL